MHYEIRLVIISTILIDFLVSLSLGGKLRCLRCAGRTPIFYATVSRRKGIAGKYPFFSWGRLGEIFFIPNKTRNKPNGQALGSWELESHQ